MLGKAIFKHAIHCVVIPVSVSLGQAAQFENFNLKMKLFIWLTKSKPHLLPKTGNNGAYSQKYLEKLITADSIKGLLFYF